MESKVVSEQDEMMLVNEESEDDYQETQEEQYYDTISEGKGEGHEEVQQQQQQSDNKPTKIVVTSLPSSAHKDFLENFFENTIKFGGGPVINVEYDEKGSSAVVEFEDPEAVNVVLKKRPIKMIEKVVRVEVYMPEEPVPMCTIEVTGPCSIIGEKQLDTLEMYFESEKRSGGGEVADSKFDFENNMVLVTFESEEVAQRVAERTNHILMKEMLQVKIHAPAKKSKDVNKEVNEQNKEPASEPIKTVKMKGASKDSVEHYFETSNLTGGGDIETIESDGEEEDVVYVSFKNAEDAENVSKTEHIVDGKNLVVTLHEPTKPPPSYKNKILIKGLNPSTTKDCLFNFIESKTVFRPKCMNYHVEQEDVVIVTFENEIDFDIIKEVFGNHQLEGASLRVNPVAVSNCISVANLAPDVTIDTIKYYFENERRSGGGRVSRVAMNEDDTCLVYFRDYSTLERVLEKNHQLSRQELDVLLYMDILGKPEGEPAERKLRIPEPIVLNDVDPVKIKFINHCKVNRDALNLQLTACYTSVQWPENKGDVRLECTVTESTKDSFKLVKHWKKNALENFNDFMKNITVTRVSFLEDIYTKLLEDLKSVNIYSPEEVAIFIDQHEIPITVVGKTKVCENLFQEIEYFAKRVLTELEKEREQVKEVTTTLKNIETMMLLADKFPGKIEEQYPDLKVKIKQQKNEIVFEGPHGQVRDAKLKMYELISNFASTTTEKLHGLSAGLYSVRKTKEHVVKRLKSKHLTAVWNVTDGCLVVCSTSGVNHNECVKIVRGSVTEDIIPLTKTSGPVVNTKNLQSKIEELHVHYAGKCHIKVSDDSSKVHICATDDVAGEILESIRTFLRLNTTTEVSCTKNTHRLIERFHKTELENISRVFHVTIDAVPGYGGFIVHGSGSEDINQCAITKLNELIQKAKQHEKKLQNPGLAEHTETPEEKENRNTIETTLPCDEDVKEEDGRK